MVECGCHDACTGLQEGRRSSDDIGQIWPPGDWTDDRGGFIQTIGVYVWGDKREAVLEALDTRVGQAEAIERRSRDASEP